MSSEAQSDSIEGTKYARQDGYAIDIEQKVVDDTHLMNNTVRNYLWQGITVTVKDRKTKEPTNILENVNGIVRAGTFNAVTF